MKSRRTSCIHYEDCLDMVARKKHPPYFFCRHDCQRFYKLYPYEDEPPTPPPEAGIKRQWRKMNKQDIEDAIRLREGGMSAAAIAEIYGVSDDLILLRTKGVVEGLKEKYKKNELIIASMYKGGASCLEISEVVGYSKSHIPKILKRLGIWKRKNKRKEKT